MSGTTLSSTWWWAVLSIAMLTVDSVFQVFPDLLQINYASAFHNLAVTLLVVPFIDVLGARNPGHRSWPWFVILPLIVLFQWPVASQLWSPQPDVPIELPGPMVAGFLLVLTMGAGNYFGTGNTLAMILTVAASILALIPLTSWGQWPAPWCSLAAMLLLVLAGVLVRVRYVDQRSLTTQNDKEEHLNAIAIWLDFRDLYGIVWAKRVMDRFNQFAQREKWEIELTLDGFVHKKTANTVQPDDRLAEHYVEHLPDRCQEILLWLLKRFVQPSFVDRYRQSTSGEQPTSDSLGT